MTEYPALNTLDKLSDYLFLSVWYIISFSHIMDYQANFSALCSDILMDLNCSTSMTQNSPRHYKVFIVFIGSGAVFHHFL